VADKNRYSDDKKKSICYAMEVELMLYALKTERRPQVVGTGLNRAVRGGSSLNVKQRGAYNQIIADSLDDTL
jgi:hypothetical protein